jgi:Lon protease-like protein
MFPLGSVLVPSAVMPLHVFEPRYRRLTEDCLAGVPEFGVVLIERGSEVGGGDQRGTVGTVARILEAATFDDGRYALGTVGVRRIRVVRWLDDDPYPRAEVVDWEDPPPGPDIAERVAAATAVLRRVLALGAELGVASTPATVELSDDPVLASYQLVAVSPFGPADQQRLLTRPTADERVAEVTTMLTDELTFLTRRLELEATDLDDDPPT